VARGGKAQDLDPVLGRTLAETQALNSPAHRVGEAARAAVHRRQQQANAGRSRSVRRAWVIVLVLLAAAGALAWLLEM